MNTKKVKVEITGPGGGITATPGVTLLRDTFFHTHLA